MLLVLHSSRWPGKIILGNFRSIAGIVILNVLPSNTLLHFLTRLLAALLQVAKISSSTDPVSGATTKKFNTAYHVPTEYFTVVRDSTL